MAQQQQQGQSFSAQNQAQSPSYGGAKDVAISNTNAGYVASKFDVMKHPLLLIQNTVLGLAAAIGITRAANYLSVGNTKNLSENISHAEALEQAPFYRLGKKMDAFLAKIPGFNQSIEGLGKLKDRIKGFVGKSEILSRVGQKYKDGSQVTWAMGKSYQDGKGTEALTELVEFLEKAPEGTFTKPETKELVEKILHDVKAGNITQDQAGMKIIKTGCLDGISAKHLNEALHVEKKGLGGAMDKLFGTTPNLHSALAKAKFFNKETKALGPISKMFNSLSLMMMEGVGGGVIGGKMAMIMSLMGLVSAFNAGSKAMVAKREKERQIQEGNLTPEQAKEMKKGPWVGEHVAAFMEDFAGFTLGGYLMTFPIGVALNKLLGWANLGRDDKKVKEAAEKMGVHGDTKLYQRSIIKYNEDLAYDQKARHYADALEGKKSHTLFTRLKKAVGFSKEADINASIIEKMKLGLDLQAPKETIISALRARIKPDNHFDEMHKMLKEKGQTGLTLKSIFVPNEINNGGFFKRLGRFAVQKPLELASKILGPDKFLMYKNKGFISNNFKKIVNACGGVGRGVLVMLVLTVPFRNTFMRVSHKIFGKPSFSQYDEVKGVYEEKEKEMQTRQATEGVSKQKIKLPNQEQAPILQASAIQIPAYQQQVSPSNPYQGEIKAAVKEAVPEHPVRSLDTYTYVPKV